MEPEVSSKTPCTTFLGRHDALRHVTQAACLRDVSGTPQRRGPGSRRSAAATRGSAAGADGLDGENGVTDWARQAGRPPLGLGYPSANRVDSGSSSGDRALRAVPGPARDPREHRSAGGDCPDPGAPCGHGTGAVPGRAVGGPAGGGACVTADAVTGRRCGRRARGLGAEAAGEGGFSRSLRSRPDDGRVGRPSAIRQAGGDPSRPECAVGIDRRPAPGRPARRSPRYSGRTPLPWDRGFEIPIR